MDQPNGRAALAGALASLAFTGNALRPVARRGWLSLPAFLAAWPVSELPLQTLATQAASAVALSARPGHRPRGPRAKVAASATALSWIGLVALHRAARRSDRTLAEALRVGLGAADPAPPPAPQPGPADVAAAGATRRSVAPPARRSGVVRMMRIHRTYVHAADLSYGEYGGANLLDVWRRPDLTAAGGAPVLVQIPGGAWTMGNKQGQGHPLLSHLVDRGWVCVSISYRLGPRNVWPAQVVDVKRALAWVKENISDHGGDPNFVAVSGGSAGGHLAALAALTPGDPAFQPGFEDADTSVAAAVPLYGVYDWTNRDGTAHDLLARHLEAKIVQARMADDPGPFESASPTGRVGPQAPPFFVVHGRNDSYVPVEQARSFVRALRAASHEPVVFAELPFAQHAFDVLGSVRAERTAEAVAQFLSTVHTRHLGRRR